ncbi:MobA/MobL family protein [Acinetobacter celticus]|uniref:MobA/MobL protein domain-containing protein n=1 Tax=Acinetobacter celticus TaxID=1891224 RepID=A0A1C3CYP4_9GAMM|nr:MobA/MobL family protein [Acinetobacter celticus]ODA13881.1 hypothetical protein BBP83_14835 [Acinetobacter celticus]
MFYADLKHNVKNKTNSRGKKAPTSANGFFYITRTAHFSKSKTGEEVEWVKSGNMPEYAKSDPKKFWVNADRFEQEKGRTSSTLTIALPNHISKKQRIELVQKFIDEFANKNGFAFTCAIHNHKSSIENKDQPHLHFMYSERPTLNNEDMHPKQFFARYNAKNPDRGGVRKLSADALGFGKNHVDHIRKTTENLINDYLSEHAPTKKIILKDVEIEVPSQVSCLSNREYNKKFGTQLKDVEQLPRWKVQDPKYTEEIADKLEAIRAVREHNNMQLYSKYYEAELARTAPEAETRTAAEVSAAPQVPILSETQKPQISAESEAFKFSETLDVERLEKAVSFDEKLLRVMQSVRDFADYDSTQNIKAQDVRYGYSQNADNKVFVFNVADVSETRLNERFKENYTNYCGNMLNALETHYSAKIDTLKESFSLSISDFDLKSVIAYHEQHEKILAQIVEPIKGFWLKSENEVFKTQLVSLENKEILINSVLDQAKQFKSSHRKEAPAAEQNKPKIESQNRLEF